MGTKITSRAVLNAGSLGRLPIKEGAEYGLGNMKRETIMGDDGPLGFSEQFSDAPFIKCTIIHAQDTDEKAIADFVGEDITLETNTNRAYTLKGAWTVDPLTVAIKDGQLEVLFNGDELIPQ
ncbi:MULTISPECIES: phage tail tube protein [Vibrio]|uniref:Phage tail protein n=2 Tax=Vibrio lentus TaxID=136468 RepID=A0A2J6VXN0_9VIBR|nr:MULTISPECIES: phage tail tube protein [Vibrio]MBU2910026.1 phage tail tube protein [Vibrio splendidus]MCC4783138.1 phage tail tube protein [Vibrio lentus]MCC4861250.1 phage tail tube protein [Vibrio splendidus]MDO6531399.1 phage tail tube protein [Vibrio splendidus]MDO6552647.1 phage tail tube protein [Vibrio splendidus]|tara:strand:- start:1061 stop:1426 length:366 start_codon:yes stop_codon:yes gene_type:complete